MTVSGHDRRFLERLADAYGIVLVDLALAPRDLRLNNPMRNAGLVLGSRTVYVTPAARFEHVLHEIAHVVTAPPGIDYETVPEDFVLMQLERCWVRESPRRCRDAVDLWQRDTVVPLLVPDTILADVPDYQACPEWRAGFRRARELGLIARDGMPTMRKATWSKAMLNEARHAVLEAI